jgi:septum formation protein
VNSPFSSTRFTLYLASASPRRAQLLQTAGIPFQRVSSAFEEPLPSPDDHAHPARFVEELSRGKALGCDVQNLPRPSIVLTADTIVWHDGQILVKPESEDEAVRMLSRLRGKSHQVFTGVCLRVPDNRVLDENEKFIVAHDVTTVHFRDVSDAWIRRYVASGEPMDKAGSYAAQERGATLIERIEGDFTNVVGLPLALLARLLETVGAPAESWWSVDGGM